VYSLRFLLTFPAFIVGFLIALVLTLKLSGIVAGVDCIPDMFIHDPCAGIRMSILPSWLYTFGSSLAAILMIALPVATAGTDRFEVAIGYFIGGATIATVTVLNFPEMFVPYVFALLFGGLAVFATKRLTSQGCEGASRRDGTTATRFRRPSLKR